MELNDIHTALATLPSAIEQAAVNVAESRKSLDQAKMEVSKARASATIFHQESKNQKILEAYVDKDDNVLLAEAKVINANADYLISIARHEKLENEFDACKKESNLMESELRSFPSQRHS